MPLTSDRGKVLFPRVIWSSPTLAVCEVPQYLPIGGVGSDFPLNENETEGNYDTSLLLLKYLVEEPVTTLK